jgi:hypothetical protein
MTRYEQVQTELRQSPKTWLVSGVAGFIGSPSMNFFEAKLDRVQGGLAVVVGKEFAGNTHAIVQFGQNMAMNVQDSGYFLTSAHIDKRFGRFVPFYEANWFYYNQNGNFLPSLGIEGGGLLNLGAGQVMGLSYVTNAVGFWYDLSEWQQLGLGYEFQVSQPVMLFNNFAMCQYVLRY